MKNIKIILISVIMLLSIFLISAVAQDGFNEWGYNFKARIFNGLLGDVDMDDDPDTYVDRSGAKSTTFPPSGDYPFEYTDADGNLREVLMDVAGAQLVGKWSKGLDMGGPDEVGTWFTYHIEGNGKIYDRNSGADEEPIYDGHLTIFCKIQKIADGNELITQLVINGQAVLIFNPPGFGVYISPKE